MDFTAVSQFQSVIRPAVSRKLSQIVQDLTHIQAEELEKGGTFLQAMDRLRDWIGPQPAAFLTWSQTDLLVLMENFNYYYRKHAIPFMAYYADVQRYCQKQMGLDLHQQIGLGNACGQLGIPTEGMQAHRALGDSLLTAQVLQRVGEASTFPKVLQKADKEFYNRALFKPVVLRDIQSPLIDRNALRFSCPGCGHPLHRATRWVFRGHAFYADLHCKSCAKDYVGRVQFKQKYDGVDIKRKLSEKQPPKTPDKKEEGKNGEGEET